ncbi:unnamed protein product [Rhizopus stolonifer]
MSTLDNHSTIGDEVGSTRRVMKFLNEPRNFSGEGRKSTGGKVEDVSATAFAWVHRMDRLRVSAKMNDVDMLLIAGDHLTGKAETWWNVVGSKFASWSEFVGGEEKTIDDLALRTKELLSLVNNEVPSFQVRIFLMAIHPTIACEIEKKDIPKDLDETIRAAKVIERSLAKYGGRVNSGVSYERINGSVSGSFSSTVSQEDVASTSTIAALVKGLEELRINVQWLGKRAGAFVNSEVTNVQENKKSSKENVGQDVGVGNINVVETVKAVHNCNKVLMNLPKRRRGNSPPPVVSTEGNTVTTLPPLQSVGSSSGYQGHGNMAPSNLNNRASSNVVPDKGKAVQHSVKPKRKARRLPLKIPVETQKLNVWTLLQNTNANLSVADVLALDKNACRDALAGIRHLRQRPKKTTRSPRTPMVVDSITVEADSWYESEGGSESDGLYSDGSDYSYDDSSDGYSDEKGGSVYRYPYSLENMKRGSPLRGIVSINGFELECVFDSGASVSVISKALADKVGLVPNGDTIELTGFDNRAAESPANVVMDVPVMVAGCLRPEHMCVLDLPVNSEVSGLCLLGVPWFKAYGIQTVIEAGVIRIPTSRGLVDHSCATTHNRQSRGAGGTKKSKHVNFLIQGEQESSSGGGLSGIDDMAKRLKDSEVQVFMVMTAGTSRRTQEV